LTNGLNLINGTVYMNTLLSSEILGNTAGYKFIRTGKIAVSNDKQLALDDGSGNIAFYVDISRITNSTTQYVPVLDCIVKNTNGELQLLIASITPSTKLGYINLDGGNGRILIYSLPNRPLSK
jgi:hypothetical protein